MRDNEGRNQNYACYAGHHAARRGRDRSQMARKRRSAGSPGCCSLQVVRHARSRKEVDLVPRMWFISVGANDESGRETFSLFRLIDVY